MRDNMQTYLEQYDVTVMSYDTANDEYGDRDVQFSAGDVVLVSEYNQCESVDFDYDQRDADDFRKSASTDERYITVLICMNKTKDDFSILYFDEDSEKDTAWELDPKCPLSDDMRDKGHDGGKFIESCIQWAVENYQERLVENWEEPEPDPDYYRD